jgi:hypothetical protein
VKELNEGGPVAKELFDDWLENVPSTVTDVPLFKERAGARTVGIDALKKLLADHFVGEEVVLKMGGYAKAAETLKNSVPANKRTRSGDLGELIATEYVDEKTAFRVPIRKLRWKSDREMPMHGNDVIAIEVKGSSIRVLKGESKSRVKFAAGVVDEAAKGLDGHDGRPNPSTLAFIAKRLYEANRDQEAKVFDTLQVDGALQPKNVFHLIFALAGTDPSKHLAGAPKAKSTSIKRATAAVVIADHAAFIEVVYTNGTKP